MLRITCPFCGRRDHHEFTYGGDASVARPSLNESSLDAWYRYVFVRTNPKGPHREYWQHTGGCRAWLIVERDTATHEISAARLAATSPQRGEHDPAADPGTSKPGSSGPGASDHGESDHGR